MPIKLLWIELNWESERERGRELEEFDKLLIKAQFRNKQNAKSFGGLSSLDSSELQRSHRYEVLLSWEGFKDIFHWIAHSAEQNKTAYWTMLNIFLATFSEFSLKWDSFND